MSSEKLDAIKARAAVVAGKPDNREPTEKEFDALIDGAIHDVPRLVAAVEAVLDLHSEGKDTRINPARSYCTYCTEGIYEPYPCPTVAAIQSALREVGK